MYIFLLVLVVWFLFVFLLVGIIASKRSQKRDGVGGSGGSFPHVDMGGNCDGGGGGAD